MDMQPQSTPKSVSDATPQRQRLIFTARRLPRMSHGYGRFVGVMRIVLPTIATALLVLVATWPYLTDQQRRYTINPQIVQGDSHHSLRMINGSYSGVDEKQRPYTLTAEVAYALTPGAPEIALEGPKADLLLENGSWIAVTAKEGAYNRHAHMLELQGLVSVFHDGGYEFRTEKATIDLGAGTARGSEPVDGQGPFGTLQAEGFVIHDRGARIEFTGKSRLDLRSSNMPQG